MRMQFSTVAAALLAATAMTPAALAQNATPLAEIRVTADNQSAAPGEVSIGAEQLDFTSPSTLSEVFAGESAVSAGGVTATGTKIYVHGLEEQNLNVSIDGVRQGSGGWHHTGNLLIDPELLKAVSIKPGVAAADDGPGALAGVISYETRDARDMLGPDEEFGGYGKLEWRSNGNSFKETATVFGRHDAMEFLLFGTLHNGDDYEDGDGNEIDNSAPESYALLGKLAFNGPNGHRFETSFENTEDSGERDFRNNFISLGGPPFAPDAVVPSVTRRSTYTLSYKDETPNDLITPSAQFGYNRTVFNTDQPAGGGALELRAESKSYSGKVNGDLATDFGPVSIGVDFALDESIGGDASGVRITQKYRELRRNLGGYAQARLKPAPMLGLSFGGRVDKQWFRGADGSDFEDSGLSGNATLEFQPLDWLTLSAAYSHVWGGYSFGEAALLGFAPFGNVIPNYVGFEASKSDNYRIGGEVEIDGFSGGVFLFRTEIANADDRHQINRGLSSDIESEGIDAHLGYRNELGFVRGKYTYADVTDDGAHPAPNNYYLVSAGGHLFTLQAGYRPAPGLTLGADAEIALEYDGYEEVGGLALPGYEAISFFAEYELQSLPGLTLRADVDNIFDEQYFRHDADGAGSAAANPTFEAGRSIALTAKMAF